MNNSENTIDSLFQELKTENLISSEQYEMLPKHIEEQEMEQPWYIKTMIGFGSWIASLLLIFFIGLAIHGLNEQAFTLAGIGIIIGAFFLRKKNEQEFLIHTSIAFSLAGQISFIVGLGISSESFNFVLVASMLMHIVLTAIFPDKIHRFLTTVFAVIAAAFLIYHNDRAYLINYLVIAIAAATVYLSLNEESYYEKGISQITKPLFYGLVIGLFGLLIASTIYILPDVQRYYSFYPHPWISSVGIGVALLLVEYMIIQKLDKPISMGMQITVYAVSVIFIAAILSAPGVVAALLVLFLGFSQANRILIGLSIAFFIFFMTVYFYGFEITFLEKTYTLIGTGVFLLASRCGLQALYKRNLDTNDKGSTKNGEQHA